MHAALRQVAVDLLGLGGDVRRQAHKQAANRGLLMLRRRRRTASEGHEDADDGDDYKEFDKGKSAFHAINSRCRSARSNSTVRLCSFLTRSMPMRQYFSSFSMPMKRRPVRMQ